MSLSPREVYRRQMYKKFKKILDLLKEIVKIKLTLMSIVFIVLEIFFQLLYISLNPFFYLFFLICVRMNSKVTISTNRKQVIQIISFRAIFL